MRKLLNYITLDIGLPRSGRMNQTRKPENPGGIEMEKIKNIEHLESTVGCLNIEKTVYRSTTCGAWLEVSEDDRVLRLGSIVEGVDECTDVHELSFGEFTIDDFWTALENIETQASEILDRTHGCEDCYSEDRELHEWKEIMWPVDPKCKTCEGYGEII